MLVLSRKKQERIVIDGNIEIVVLKVGSTVKLGVRAPAGMKIRRSDVAQEPRIDPATR